MVNQDNHLGLEVGSCSDSYLDFSDDFHSVVKRQMTLTQLGMLGKNDNLYKNTQHFHTINLYA